MSNQEIKELRKELEAKIRAGDNDGFYALLMIVLLFRLIVCIGFYNVQLQIDELREIPSESEVLGDD